MAKLSLNLPEDLQKEWDGMLNFNVANWVKPDAKASIDEFNGHHMQPTFSADGVKYAYDNWIPKESDVIIASFPRTGTNWTTEIIRQIIYGRDEKMLDTLSSTPIQMMFYEAGGPSKFKLLDHLPFPRRLMATHLPSTLMNVEKIKRANAKVVCVVRNPKDQAISWFHFAPKLPYMQLEPVKQLINAEWPQFLDHYVNGKMPIGMRPGEWYLDHLKGWNEHADDKNVMFVCFEDMKKNLPKEVKRLADYLGVKLTESEIMDVCEKCGFKSMKENIDQVEGIQEQLKHDIGVMRKGEVGGWKTKFTVNQSELIDSLVDEKLSSTNIQFKYTI